MKRRNVNGDQNESSSRSSKKGMQESREEPCEICGSVGIAGLMMVCFNCRDTREHTYCAKVFQQSVPLIWICEACRSSSRVLLIPAVAEDQMDSETIVVDRSLEPKISHSSRVDDHERTNGMEDQDDAVDFAKETSLVFNDSSQNNEKHQPSQAFPKKRKTFQLMGKHITL